MDQFIADSGTFTLNGPNFYKRGFGHMYNYGDGGGSLWVDNLEKNVHSVEFSVSGLDVGDYDLCYWWGNNCGNSTAKVNIKDGNEPIGKDLILLRSGQEAISVSGIGSDIPQYGGGIYWRVWGIGHRCDSGTLHFKIEPEPRANYAGCWEVPHIAGIIRREMDATPDTDPEYVPTSNRSKPHPLYSN